MTKKETIALRYYTALTEMTGETFNDNDVHYLATHRSAEWLLNKSVEQEEKLEKKRAADKKKAYFESEEGKAAMETLKNMWENHTDEVLQTDAAAETVIEDYLNAKYGRNDIMARVSGDRLNIGIRKMESNNKEFIFGHDFSVCFNLEKYSFNKGKTEINFSTMGSFDPSEDTNYGFRMKLLGDFSTDLSLTDFCREAVKPCIEVRESYEPLRNAAGAWKEDPFNNPKPWELLAA